jgi:alkylation response protein AidB-like acyl-CoA dehydrogenase
LGQGQVSTSASASAAASASASASEWTYPGTTGRNNVVETVQRFRQRAAEWLSDNGGRAPRDYGAILPPELRDGAVAWQFALFDARLTGISWPTEYGGLGLTPEHHAAWLELAAGASVPPYLNMVGYVLAGGSIQLYGTDEQKRRHLRRILTGEDVWCQLFSEPGAGSDLASLTTRAARDGDTFVVNGQKVWCSNGRVADWGILLARTDPDAPKHRGISFFLLDMHTAGVETRPLRQITGDAEFDEVFLSDVRIPADCLLGPLDDGWRVAMTTLTNERGSVGAGAISLERRVQSMTSVSASARGPVARQRAASLYSTGRALVALIGRQGPVASPAASLSKLGMSELGFEAANLSADLTGAEALLEGPTTRALLASPAGRIAGGTSQVQRNIIGERLLGLPKEPGV